MVGRVCARCNQCKCKCKKPTPKPKPYRDAAYRAAREWFLAIKPICEDCQFRASNEVHHTMKLSLYPETLLDVSTWKALCSSCHGRRTANHE